MLKYIQIKLTDIDDNAIKTSLVIFTGYSKAPITLVVGTLLVSTASPVLSMPLLKSCSVIHCSSSWSCSKSVLTPLASHRSVSTLIHSYRLRLVHPSVPINSVNLLQSANSFLFYSEPFSIQHSISQFFQFPLVVKVHRWPFRKSIPPSFGDFFHQFLFSVTDVLYFYLLLLHCHFNFLLLHNLLVVDCLLFNNFLLSLFNFYFLLFLLHFLLHTLFLWRRLFIIVLSLVWVWRFVFFVIWYDEFILFRRELIFVDLIRIDAFDFFYDSFKLDPIVWILFKHDLRLIVFLLFFCLLF